MNAQQEKAYFDYLNAAADEVYRQMNENPGLPISVDPDVADYMGAFDDDAMDLAEALDGDAPEVS